MPAVVSIIIVTWNTRDLTLAAVESVIKHEVSVPYEILVVDNASSDGTADLLRSRYPDVRVLENRENVGFANANNIGVKAANGEFVLLLNSDAYLIEEILPECLSLFQRMPGAGILALRLNNSDGSLQPGVFRFPTLFSAFTEIFHTTSGITRDMTRFQLNLDKALNRVDWATGAFLMVRKTDYLRVGGMDESIFMYAEDIDFCRRSLSQGIPCFYAPGKSLVHLGGGSQGKSIQQTLLLTDNGRMAYWKKWHGPFSSLLLRKNFILRSLIRGIVLVGYSQLQRNPLVELKGKAHLRHALYLLRHLHG